MSERDPLYDPIELLTKSTASDAYNDAERTALAEFKLVEEALRREQKKLNNHTPLRPKKSIQATAKKRTENVQQLTNRLIVMSQSRVLKPVVERAYRNAYEREMEQHCNEYIVESILRQQEIVSHWQKNRSRAEDNYPKIQHSIPKENKQADSVKHREQMTSPPKAMSIALLIIAILASTSLMYGSTLADTPKQSASPKSGTTYTYGSYSDYSPPPIFDFEPIPTFDFEPIPTFDFDIFDATETPTITIESASIEFIHYPAIARRNEEVTVKIRGKPYTTYSITVTYSSGVSEAEGLYSKGSDSDGYVSWTWKVGGRTSFGTYPITVSGGGISETIYFRVVS